MATIACSTCGAELPTWAKPGQLSKCPKCGLLNRAPEKPAGYVPLSPREYAPAPKPQPAAMALPAAGVKLSGYAFQFGFWAACGAWVFTLVLALAGTLIGLLFLLLVRAGHGP